MAENDSDAFSNGPDEPKPEYSSKRLIFSTLSEQEEENYRYWLSITPEQRIANTTSLIRHIFADQLRESRAHNRIIFDSL
jgi:uncharacterized protein (UPF0262 family)